MVVTRACRGATAVLMLVTGQMKNTWSSHDAGSEIVVLEHA